MCDGNVSQIMFLRSLGDTTGSQWAFQKLINLCLNRSVEFDKIKEGG